MPRDNDAARSRDAQTDTQTDEQISDIAAQLSVEMPIPSESAEEIARTEDQESAPENALQEGERDAAGELWNPAIHSTSSDGRGVKTAKGLWRRRRVVGGSARAASVVGARITDVPPAATVAATQARAAGVACAESLLMFCQLIGGEEWAPQKTDKQDERAMMHEAWGNYFVATNRTEFPPGLALTIACTGYAAPRFTMPKTRSRMQRMKEWTAAKYAKWKVRKENRGTPQKSTRELDIESSDKVRVPPAARGRPAS